MFDIPTFRLCSIVHHINIFIMATSNTYMTNKRHIKLNLSSPKHDLQWTHLKKLFGLQWFNRECERVPESVHARGAVHAHVADVHVLARAHAEPVRHLHCERGEQ